MRPALVMPVHLLLWILLTSRNVTYVPIADMAIYKGGVAREIMNTSTVRFRCYLSVNLQ
jgi:hypothetical protein